MSQFLNKLLRGTSRSAREMAVDRLTWIVVAVFLNLTSWSHAEVTLSVGSSTITARYIITAVPTAGDNARKKLTFGMTGTEISPRIGYVTSISPSYNFNGFPGAELNAYNVHDFSPSFVFTAPPGVKIKITESAVAWTNAGTIINPDAGTVTKVAYYQGDYGFSHETEQGGVGANRTSKKGNAVLDPVDVTTGEFHQDEVDLHVNGPLPIEVHRIYSSRNTASNEFGYGWLSGYSSYLIPSTDLSTIQAVASDGSVVTYRRVGTSDLWTLGAADNPELTDNSGGAGNLFNATIGRTIAGDGTVSYLWQLADGSTRNFSVRQFPTADLVRQRPYLDKWIDNRGNALTFVYGTSTTANDYGKINLIQSSNGSSVSFTYDAGGLITQAMASDGRTVNYTYDTIGGDLTGVQLPDGAQFSYAYGVNTGGSNHLIVQETKPGGRVLQNIYDSSGRVAAQKATVGLDSAPVTNGTFDYSIAGQTTVRDAFNNPTVYHYTGNMITQVVDPLGQTTTKTWFTTTDTAAGAYQGNVSSMTDPRGLVTTYLYDARGNVIETQKVGDLDGDPATTETSTTSAIFNSLNQPISMTNATGIVTTFTYGDVNYPYLPTQIVTSIGGTTIRTDKLEYVAQFDPVNPTTLFSNGLLFRKTTALGSPAQAVTEFQYNAAGFVTQQKDYTGTADPDVVTTFAYNGRGELAATTDGDGRSTNYTYDGLSRLLTKVVKDETGTVLGIWITTYTGNGEVATTVGPRMGVANLVTNTYDGAGRPVTKTVARSQAAADGSGVVASATATTSYVHDYFGNLTSMTDPNGNITTFTYDAIGQMLSQITAGLRSELFQYEPGGKVSQYTNPLGGVIKKYYTAAGQLRRQENPDGSVLEWRYCVCGRLIKEVLSNGSYRDIDYDDISQKVTRTLKRSDGSVLATDVSEFDLRGNLIRHTDADGFVKTVTYDGLSRVKTTTGPAAIAGSAQQVTSTIYGASAKTFSFQNGLNETSVMTSDALGRPLQTLVQSAGGATIRTTSYAYSADHNAVTVKEGSGAGAISRTAYTDTVGKPILTVLGDGKFARTAYDLNSNVLSMTDELNQTTSFGYNGLDQATSQTLPDGTVTTFTYNGAGEELTRGMANGTLIHEQTYDNSGRKLTERLYFGATNTRQFSYAYYASTSPYAGRLQTVTGPRDTVTTVYDDFLRPQTVTTTGALPETNSTTTYAYDRRNLVTEVDQSSPDNAAGPASQVFRTFDGYGQLLTETVTIAGLVHSTITQTWNAAGRRASLTEAGATIASPLFAYQYQADGAMTQVTANSQNYAFTYADNGLLMSRSNPFRTLTVNSRDAVGRILQQTNMVGGSPAMVEAMTWRDNSTLSSYGVSRTGAGGWAESRAYSYNSRGQLLSEGYSPAAGQSTALTYAFDGGTTNLGIRTDAKLGPGVTNSWGETAATAINSLARVTTDQISESLHAVPASGISLGADHVDLIVDGVAQGRASHPGHADPVGSWSATLNLAPGSHTLTVNAVHPSNQYTATASSTFTVASNGTNTTIASTYDDDGNVTSRTWASGRVQTLTWDAFGRLLKVTDRDTANNGSDWAAVYDGLGRRLKTTQQQIVNGVGSGGPTATTSSYDPQVEFLEIGVAIDGAKAWKIYGPDINGRYGSLQGTGGLEATVVDANGATKGHISDQFGNGIGSIVGGSVSWSATRVTAYGPLPGSPTETLTDIARLAEAAVWRSRRVDATGFVWLGARLYEPISGRFISADPEGHAASMSLYSYANGDPINYIDADGRIGKKIVSVASPADEHKSLCDGILAGSIQQGNAAAFYMQKIEEAYNVASHITPPDRLKLLRDDSIATIPIVGPIYEMSREEEENEKLKAAGLLHLDMYAEISEFHSFEMDLPKVAKLGRIAGSALMVYNVSKMGIHQLAAVEPYGGTFSEYLNDRGMSPDLKRAVAAANAESIRLNDYWLNNCQ